MTKILPYSNIFRSHMFCVILFYVISRWGILTEDFEALFEIVSDIETMQHYPVPFDEDKK